MAAVAIITLLSACGVEGKPDADAEGMEAWYESNAEVIESARGMIEINTHNCFPSCSSFGIYLKRSGEAGISVFRTFDDGLRRVVSYEGLEKKQVSPAAHVKLRELIEELDVAGLEQGTPHKPLACASKLEPLLTLRSNGQLGTEYWLWLSCDAHRAIALQIAAAAVELTESSHIVEKWPLPPRR